MKKTKETEDKCEVCGARCISYAPRLTTCDDICYRAKAAGRSRGRQIAYEVRKSLQGLWGEDTPPQNECAYIESNNYNQPYLAIT